MRTNFRHESIVESSTHSVRWVDEVATQAFATALAQAPTIRTAFITLQGDLGAGKTTFVRYLLQALGVTGRIKSPTYAIVESYDLPALAISHFDFYRFNDPLEWEDAGFRDIFASAGLKLAEWPEKAAALLPHADLELHILTAADGVRTVRMHAHSAVGRALLQSVANQETPP